MRLRSLAILTCLLATACGPGRSAPAPDAGTDPAPPDPAPAPARVVQAAPAADPDPAVPADPLPGGVQPLTQEQRRIFWSSPEDDVPESRVDNRHYVHSNERKHHLYFAHMDCSSDGAYLGVGSDQNYTMLARCRAPYAWILDYDEIVPMLHQVHRALILESGTAREFIDRWSEDAQQSSLEIIRKHAPDDPRLADLEAIYTKYRAKLHDHFDRLAKRMFAGEPASWLASEEDYAYVRGMYMAGRIRPMMGNLLADRAVKGTGDACRELGVPMRVIYLTNVEELVQYNDAMRASFRSLPVDEKSVVLRTLAYTNGYAIADNKWHYNVQSALDFQARLATKVTRVQVFMHARENMGKGGFSTLGL